MIRRFSPFILAAQYLTDVLLTLAAVKGAEELRLHIVTGLEVREGIAQFFAVQPSVYALILGIWACFFVVFGAFDSRRHDSLLVDIGRLWLSITVSMLVLASTFYFLGLQPPLAPSRLFYAYFYVLDLMLLTAAHVLAFQIGAFLRRRGKDLRRVLLIGAGIQARHVAVRLQRQEATGLALVGQVSAANEPSVPGLPRLGDIGDLADIVQAKAINEVIVALPASAHAEVLRANAELQDADVNLRILPDVLEMAAMRARVDDFYGLPLISLREPSMNPAQAGVKRIFDVVIGGLLFILLLPIMVVIAIWVRLDSPGPALIHQRRVGIGGTSFLMHKFRSMSWDACELDAAVEKRRNDPRVTRTGRWLRRTSLDELPQLWNVLVGEMSLVGPRPELPAIADRYEPWQRKRFNVPPGMTGWWQISGRSDKSMHLNTEIDLFYVQNYSILLDIQILLRTLGAVIRGTGAY